MFLAKYTSLQPSDDFGLKPTKYNYLVRLGASTNTILPVPPTSKTYKALIKASVPQNVFMAINEPAEAPSGALFVQSGSEMVGYWGMMCREVTRDDVLNFFTETADTDVCVSFFEVIAS